MAKAKRADRREDALSHERIVDAAIALLDEEGEDGLTFRALATRLSTGSGAIYWHVANKDELLFAASDALVARAMSAIAPRGGPRKAIHRIAIAVFDLVDAHPWVGAELSRAPSKTAMLRIFERIGRQIQAMGARGGAQFTAASALLSYIVGVSVQNAANGREFGPDANRTEILEKVSAEWEALDAEEYSFTRKVASRLREHDDRVEFLAGIDLILAGVEASL